MLRKLSTIIYCCQGNVLVMNGLFRKILKSSVAAYLASLAAAAVVVLVVLFIQKKTRWKWAGNLT